MTKLINVAPPARVTIAAMICVVAGSANAQQIGSVEEGRRLAREVATTSSARFGAASPTQLCERFCTSSDPKRPTFSLASLPPQWLRGDHADRRGLSNF
jgi:hypothetical protein